MKLYLRLAGILVTIGCVAVAPGAAVAQPITSPSPPPSVPPASENIASASDGSNSDQSYVLGPDDVVEIEILGRADFRTRARIGSDGKIQVPFLGDVDAANRTARELGEQIGRALEAGGYFTNPVMRVEIVGYASRYAIVLGAVGSPGLVPINRAYRLSEIIARVGGIRADGADHIVVRPENGPERRVAVKAMAMGGAAEDPQVAPGDKIYVPTAEVFYLSGQVRSPGAYPAGSDMTFRMAIARGGGITELGSERRIKVTRNGQEMDRVDLDAKLQPGDIIAVGERLF